MELGTSYKYPVKKKVENRKKSFTVIVVRHSVRLQDISKEYAVTNRFIVVLMVILLLLPFASIFSERLGHPSFLLNTLSCFVKDHTEESCPTCGLTHSVLSLYKGDFQESAAQHAWGFLFVAVLVIQLCLRIVPLIGKQVWIPYVDMAQMFFCGLIFKFIMASNNIAL
jgi:hypothetical protein